MTFLPSFPGQARMSDVFKARWDKYGPIIHLAESLMRGPSELGEGERELIHAYSSALNACGLCTGAHTAVAEAFGIPRPVVEALVDNIDSAPIEDRMKPILRYVKKLALTPSATTPRDVATILEAGWSAAAVQDAVLVCAYSNMMNRIVEGLGLTTNEEMLASAADRLKDSYLADYSEMPKLADAAMKQPE